jgi:transposase InsO family protein
MRLCYTPVKSPESNGIAEAYVKTLKREYIHVTPLPDVATVLGLIAGWIEDYNDTPHTQG